MAHRWRHVLSHKLLTRYLLLTNVLISGGVDSLGDIIEQKLEHRDTISWPRTARMGVVGLAFGMSDHFWYKFIDNLLPKRTARVVAKKVLLDMCVMGPPHIVVFYLSMCQLEGKTWTESMDELKDKFLITYALEWTFWPLAQAVNFYFLPPSLRVLFENAVGLCWAIVLSKLKHKESSDSEQLCPVDIHNRLDSSQDTGSNR